MSQEDRGVKQSAHDDQVADDVGERTDKGTFEAFGGDGVPKGFDIRKRVGISHYLDGSGSPDLSSRCSHDFWKLGNDRNTSSFAAEARVL